MNLENQKYDAFISYKHSELDSFVAKSLHFELEKFRLPKSLVAEKNMQKSRIERVFRDKEELPISNDLNDPLYNALANSEYLLVICTPRLPESEWCRKEITTFIELHGREKIFLILAEGEPEESFPKELLYEEIKTTDEAGNEIIKKKTIEPLAADVRGKNASERKKKIREEILRIAAPMFGLNYDELKQRHREQKQKEILFISLACSGLCLLLGSFFISTSLQIRSQSKQIEKQNQEITSLMGELEEQYNQIRINFARNISEVSSSLLKQGNRLEAMYLARSVMPDEDKNAELPFVAEAQYALSDALYIYEDGNRFCPIRNYNVDTKIADISISEDNSKMIILDEYNRLWVWNLVTNEMLFQSDVLTSLNYEIVGNSVFYTSDNSLYEYNINTNQNILISQNAKYCFSNQDGTLYTYLKYNESETKYYLVCAEEKNDHILFETELALNTNMMVGVDIIGAFNEDNRSLLLIHSTSQQREYSIYDVASGNCIVTQKENIDKTIILSNCCYRNGAYYFSYSAYGSSMYDSRFSVIKCFDALTLDVIWEKEVNNYIKKIKAFEIDNQNYLIGTGSESLVLFDSQNGECIQSYSFDMLVVDNFYVLKDGSIVFFQYDGMPIIYTIETNETRELNSWFRDNPGECLNVVIIKGDIYYLKRDSMQVVLYRMTAGRRQEVLAETTYYDSDRNYNENGTLCLHVEELKTVMYDTATATEIFSFQSPYTFSCGFFVKDGEENFVIYNTNSSDFEWIVYDSKTGDKIDRFILDSDHQVIGYSNDGTKMYLKGLEHDDAGNYGYIFKVYDVKTGKLLSKQPFDGFIPYDEFVYVSDDLSVYAHVLPLDETIELYRADSDKPYLKKKIAGLSGGSIDMTEDGKYIAVLNGSNQVMIYSSADLSLVETYQKNSIIYSINIKWNEELKVYFLTTDEETMILDENLSRIALIKNFIGYNKNKELLIQKSYGYLYGYPFYTREMIIQEADEILNGYVLPDYLKKTYGVE